MKQALSFIISIVALSSVLLAAESRNSRKEQQTALQNSSSVGYQTARFRVLRHTIRLP